MKLKNEAKPRLRGLASYDEINAIILAGGRNSRMQGEDKAFLKIEGRPIIEMLIETLKPLVNKIIVVTNSPKKYNKYKVTLVADEVLGKGPLMGIYSGLKASLAKYNFVVACDMPLVSGALIEYMMKISDGYDVVVPKIEGEYHPLFGIYSKHCLSAIQEALRKNRLNVRGVFPKLNCCFMTKKEAERFDKNLSSLMNLNTKEDVIRVNSRL